jgi:hypothetical protein
VTDRSTLVRLGMDVTNYVSGAQQATQATQGISDTATKAADAVSSSSIVTAAKVTAAGVAVGLFLHTAIGAAGDAEQATLHLNFAYQQFPKLADASLASLKALADEQEKKTGIDHNSTESAIALLAQYNLTGQQIIALIPLVADYAAITGQDMTSAADTVGKALLGQGRGLKAVGINFKDTGTLAGNYAEIMADLQAKVGGFAALEAGTAAGSTTKFHDELVKVEETIGGALVPGMKVVEGGLTDVVAEFNKLPGPVKDSAVGILAVVGATGYLLPKLSSVKQAYEVLSGKIVAATTVMEENTVVDKAAGTAAMGTADKMFAAASKYAGIAALVAAAAYAAKSAGDAFQHNQGWDVQPANKASLTLLQVAQSGKITQDQMISLGSEGKSLADVLYTIGDPSLATKLAHVGENLSPATWFSGTSVKAATDALGSIDAGLASLATNGHGPEAASAFAVVTAAAKQQGITVNQLAGLLPLYTAATYNAAHANDGTYASWWKTWSGQQAALAASKAGFAALLVPAAGMGVISAQIATQTPAATRSLAALGAAAQTDTNQLLGLYNATLGGKLTADQWKQSLFNLTDTIKSNGHSVSTNTEKGLANRDALLSMAQSAVQTAESRLKDGQALDVVAPKLAANISQIEQAGIKGGLTKKQVDNLVGSYKTVPASVTTLIKAEGIAAAEQKLAALKAAFLALPGVTSTAGLGVLKNNPPSFTATTTGHAAGGPIVGPGTATSDSIWTPTSAGEWVMQAAAVSRYGPGFMRAVNSGTYSPSGGVTVLPGAVTVTVGEGAGVTVAQVEAVVDKALIKLVDHIGAGATG